MSRNRFPPSVLWLAFALPLLCLGLLLARPPLPLGLSLPMDVIITLAFPLGIASIGFGIAAIIWQLAAKGYFNDRLPDSRLQSLPLAMSLVAGLLPLLSGALIMAGWVYTKDTGFGVAGLLNILGGLVLFGVGVGGVTWHLMAWGTAGIRIRGVLVPVWAVILLLLANFPAAWACVEYASSAVD